MARAQNLLGTRSSRDNRPPVKSIGPVHARESRRHIIVSMNGYPPSMAPPPIMPAGAVWQTHKSPDGREYYYNTATKQTQWTKPDELMTDDEVRIVLSLQTMC